MAARFYEQDVKSKLKDKRKLSAFLDTIIREHNNVKKIDLSYVFCSDEYLLQINKDFLKHDTFTDIVTFDMSAKAGELTGEMYISVERIAENAHEFSISYEEELHRVIFHGALHLCGFKDKKTADKQEMRKQENICLQQYFSHK
ncbi:MAG: rRNA maturation RNase YbeY [Sphingobacteriales bacterium]|nr:MAG: rRNA maturation RNase YbeY [Sphingobacteriales bacterium]